MSREVLQKYQPEYPKEINVFHLVLATSSRPCASFETDNPQLLCFLFKEQKERTSQRITLGLHGVGLSLVNNEKSIEVSYIGIKP